MPSFDRYALSAPTSPILPNVNISPSSPKFPFFSLVDEWKLINLCTAPFFHWILVISETLFSMVITSSTIMRRYFLFGLSAGVLSLILRANPPIAVSGFLSSWATLFAIFPIAASLSASTNCLFFCFNSSVLSWTFFCPFIS